MTRLAWRLQNIFSARLLHVLGIEGGSKNGFESSRHHPRLGCSLRSGIGCEDTPRHGSRVFIPPYHQGALKSWWWCLYRGLALGRSRVAVLRQCEKQGKISKGQVRHEEPQAFRLLPPPPLPEKWNNSLLKYPSLIGCVRVTLVTRHRHWNSDGRSRWPTPRQSRDKQESRKDSFALRFLFPAAGVGCRELKAPTFLQPCPTLPLALHPPQLSLPPHQLALRSTVASCASNRPICPGLSTGTLISTLPIRPFVLIGTYLVNGITPSCATY